MILDHFLSLKDFGNTFFQLSAESLLQVLGLIHPGKLFDFQGLGVHTLPFEHQEEEPKLFDEKAYDVRTLLSMKKGDVF